MKSFYSTILLLTCLVAGAQQKPPFTMSPKFIHPGDKVVISYRTGDGSSLDGQKTVTGIIYLYVNHKWIADDLNLQKNDTAWVDSYTIPEGCGLLVCKFKGENGMVDNGRQKYIYASLVGQKDGPEMPGAYVGWAKLRYSPFANEVPQLVNNDSIADDVFIYWIKMELKYHPESRIVYFYDALRAVAKAYAPDVANAKIRKELASVSKLDNIDESILLKVQEGYSSLLGDKQRADSMEQVILSKYPKGILARDKAINQLYTKMSIDEKVAQWPQFVKDFPIAKFKGVHSWSSDLFYTKLYSSITFNPIVKSNDYSILDKMVPESPLSCLFDFHRHVINTPVVNKLFIDNKKLTPEFLLPYSTLIINRVILSEDDRELAAENFCSPKEWKARVKKQFTTTFQSHALILSLVGQYQQAFEFAEPLVEEFGYKNSDFNNLYVQLLQKTGKDNQVMPYIKGSLMENAATPEMIDLLKKDYVAQHKSEQGFDAYMESFKSKENVKASEEEWKQGLTRKEIEPFKLERMDGEIVDIAKLKGKIIILDFWATWCAPCKAAMPGMQLAVKKYANDPDVVFLFIATQEFNPNYKEQIKKFIDEKGFTFNILYDGLNPETKKLDLVYEKYAQSIGFSGIPQKMIIGKDGLLRWRSTGYNGSPTGLADEISYIIELLKKESK